jgi:hypothetical protein
MMSSPAYCWFLEEIMVDGSDRSDRRPRWEYEVVTSYPSVIIINTSVFLNGEADWLGDGKKAMPSLTPKRLSPLSDKYVPIIGSQLIKLLTSFKPVNAFPVLTNGKSPAANPQRHSG